MVAKKRTKAKKNTVKKRRYVHIGNPKCASSTLQIDFFPKHPQIMHLGNGHEKRVNRYIDEGVTIVAEVDFRYKKDFVFDPEKSKSYLQPHFEAADKDDGIKVVGLSSEFLSFTLGNEVDTADKAKRIYDVFGKNTIIILIFREQISLLKSLYSELVKGGYYSDIKQFFEYTYIYQDRNWCLDFCFDKVFETYQELFGKENICALPLELLKENESEFIGKICSALEIDSFSEELRPLNKAIDKLEVLEQLRGFNGRFKHEFGSAFYEPFNSSRMRDYFAKELGIAVPRERSISDSVRMPLTQAAANVNKKKAGPILDLTPPKAIVDRLHAIYGPSNRKLMELTGFPLDKYGYHLGEPESSQEKPDRAMDPSAA